MSKEVCEYRVSLRGRPVGSYRLTTLAKHKIVLLEAQLDLQGALGRKSVYQSSNVQRDSLISLRFVETYRSGAETRTFEVDFNQDEGMVTARRGNRDQASIPYIQAYRDPLSIFYELRQTDSARLQLPLIGKDVVLEHVSDVTLTTSLGAKQALVYSCHPGGNYIYIEDNSSRTILKLSQRLDGQMLEASLVKVSYEAESRKPERRDRKHRLSGVAARPPRAYQSGRPPRSSQRRDNQQQDNQHRDNQHRDNQHQNSGQTSSYRDRGNQQHERAGNLSRVGSQRDGGQHGGAQRDGTQRDGTQRDGTQRDGAQRDNMPRDNTQRNSSSRGRSRSQRKRASQSTRRSSRQGANRQGANRQGANRQGANRQGANHQSSGPQGQRRATTSSDQQADHQRNHQEGDPSQQDKQTRTKKRSNPKRNKSARHPNRSRKDNSKSRENSE
jgi:hypothetical protein